MAQYQQPPPPPQQQFAQQQSQGFQNQRQKRGQRGRGNNRRDNKNHDGQEPWNTFGSDSRNVQNVQSNSSYNVSQSFHHSMFIVFALFASNFIKDCRCENSRFLVKSLSYRLNFLFIHQPLISLISKAMIKKQLLEYSELRSVYPSLVKYDI